MVSAAEEGNPEVLQRADRASPTQVYNALALCVPAVPARVLVLGSRLVQESTLSRVSRQASLGVRLLGFAGRIPKLYIRASLPTSFSGVQGLPPPPEWDQLLTCQTHRSVR